MGFFGHPEGYRSVFHEEIFNLCYYSSGGFPFSDVYDLPVEKRKFFLRLLENAKKNEKDAVDNAQKKSGTVKGDSPFPTPARYSGIRYDKIPTK